MKAMSAVSGIWLESQADVAEMQRIISTPENSKMLLEDEERFLLPSETRLLMVEEVNNGTTL